MSNYRMKRASFGRHVPKLSADGSVVIIHCRNDRPCIAVADPDGRDDHPKEYLDEVSFCTGSATIANAIRGGLLRLTATNTAKTRRRLTEPESRFTVRSAFTWMSDFVGVLLGALMLMLLPDGSLAQEAITGWGPVKFGMSRAAVKQATNSQQLTRCFEAYRPLNCYPEQFNQVVKGVSFYIMVFFADDGGAARVDVQATRLGPEAIQIYLEFKNGFFEKYGAGTEESSEPQNHCVEGRRRWDSNERVPNYAWLTGSVTKSVIIRDGASLVWLITKHDICPQTPPERIPALSQVDKYPNWDLWAVYRRPPDKLPDPF